MTESKATKIEQIDLLLDELVAEYVAEAIAEGAPDGIDGGAARLGILLGMLVRHAGDHEMDGDDLAEAVLTAYRTTLGAGPPVL